MGAPPRIRLTETRPGLYQTWWSVPPDTDPGRYILRGRMTQEGMVRAVVPLGSLVVAPRVATTPPPPTTPAPPVAPPRTGAPPPGAPPVAAPAAPVGQVTPAFLDFVHQGLRPDIPFWVTPDDSVVIGVRNSASGVRLTAAARVWSPSTPQGLDSETPWPPVSPIAFAFPEAFAGSAVPITPPTDRSLQLTSLSLAQGYLVGVTVVATGGAPKRGQCLVTISLRRGAAGAATTFQTLAQDYVTSTLGPSWPPGRLIAGIEGPGVIRVIAVATPAVGQNWTQTVPTGARWIIRLIQSVFTSTAPNNQQPNLQIADATGLNLQIQSPVKVVGAGTTVFEWFAGGPSLVAQNNVDQLSLPNPLILVPGAYVRVSTAGILAGDAWTGIQLWVEELIED